jgi:DNA-binding response OmpR family regulator
MKYRILYLEDEAILGKLVADALKQHGYEVMQITNGADALRSGNIFQPHLYLLDIMVPGKDGYELASQIRAIDKKTPIIFLTAKIRSEDLVEGFRSGCNDYIRKPFSMDEVLLRVQNWLIEKHSLPQEVFATTCDLAGLKFFPHKQSLEKNGQVIPLSYKETTVLYLLWQSRGNVLARDFIMKKVWGNDNVFNSRSLDVYVTRLRKYLKDTPNQIVTLKGVGYRFLCEKQE